MIQDSGKRRSALKIMGQLIGLVRPLLHVMIGAVVLGAAGYLCAICLTILAGQQLVRILNGEVITKGIFTVLLVAAVLRGVLHYMEQYWGIRYTIMDPLQLLMIELMSYWYCLLES